MWWRIEIGKDGLVRDCKRVADPGPETQSIFYIEGATEEAVRELALKAYRAYFAAGNRKRRERYALEGKCKCGRVREDADFQTCRACRSKRPLYAERHALREKGIEPPPLDRRVAVAERRNVEADEARLRVLEEVAHALNGSMSYAGFKRWLAGEIERLELRLEARRVA